MKLRLRRILFAVLAGVCLPGLVGGCAGKDDSDANKKLSPAEKQMRDQKKDD